MAWVWSVSLSSTAIRARDTCRAQREDLAVAVDVLAVALAVAGELMPSYSAYPRLNVVDARPVRSQRGAKPTTRARAEAPVCPRASPALPGGGYEMAFQANTGSLIAVRHDWRGRTGNRNGLEPGSCERPVDAVMRSRVSRRARRPRPA